MFLFAIVMMLVGEGVTTPVASVAVASHLSSTVRMHRATTKDRNVDISPSQMSLRGADIVE